MLLRNLARLGRWTGKQRFAELLLAGVLAGWLSLFGGLCSAASQQVQEYLGPWDVLVSSDGKTAYVLCRDAQAILVVETVEGKVVNQLKLEAIPTAFAFGPGERCLFVACGEGQGCVCAVDLSTGKVVKKMPAGHSPSAIAVGPGGDRLYVANRFQNNVLVLDAAEGQTVATIPVVREPVAVALTPDGKQLVVANHLPLAPADSYDVAACVSVIDTSSYQVTHIRLLNGSTSVRGVCVAPDGRHAYVVHLLSRYQMPTTQLERGWMNTNAMSIINLESKSLWNTVLLDEVDLGAANPWGIRCTPDGQYICITHAGTHEVTVIDRKALHDKIASVPADMEATRAAGRLENRQLYSSLIQSDIPNDLAFLVDVRRRIRLQGRGPWGWLGADRTEANGPRGLAVTDSKVFVAVYFSDKLAVVDLQAPPARQVRLIPLGPAPKLTVVRQGEMNFHDAWLCFQHWQSCASCHPDGRADALNWDLMNDGLGNPKNTRSMLLSHLTQPLMAAGVRPDVRAAVEAGFVHIQFAIRPAEEIDAVVEYIRALKPVPSPYLENGNLSEKARRGRELFFSERVGCGKCHPEPVYTDSRLHNVGSRGQYDDRDEFTSPTLIECWRTAPYMHDGHYTDLRSLFREGKHGATHGAVMELTDEELEALIAFVLSL
ncbi:MAG: hypothetical protein NZ899_04040 [Thermoguttaceae bacterium]|nr:hypothetical protein [Thermoguttaceae bacterium]MDW8077695.1 hypothetical protein [Thermoguttaceae bacterium]